MAIEFHYEKRIDNSAVVRDVDARQRRQWFLLTLLASLFAIGLFFYGWQFYRGTLVGYAHSDALKEAQSLLETNQQYRARLNTMAAPDRIGDAAAAMGMVPGAAGQKVVFRPSPADVLDRPALALATKE